MRICSICAALSDSALVLRDWFSPVVPATPPVVAAVVDCPLVPSAELREVPAAERPLKMASIASMWRMASLCCSVACAPACWVAVAGRWVVCGSADDPGVVAPVIPLVPAVPIRSELRPDVPVASDVLVADSAAAPAVAVVDAVSVVAGDVLEGFELVVPVGEGWPAGELVVGAPVPVLAAPPPALRSNSIR